MPSVLFICTANQIRSPLAEAMFRHKLATLHSLDDWLIGSAGTWASIGASAMLLAQQIASESGLDLSNHFSRAVNRALLNRYNLILTMEYGHKESLQVEFPEFAGKIYLFSEMADGIYEVPDPVGGSIEEYRKTAEIIQELITRGLKKIYLLAQDPQPDHPV